MTKQRYLFKKYPAYRYKKGEEPVIVQNEKEDEEHLSNGWKKTPKDAIVEEITEKNLQVEIEKVEKAVEKATALTNALLRVPKTRSKKDLRWLAEELDIDLPADASLKEMRKIILDEAKQPIINEGEK